MGSTRCDRNAPKAHGRKSYGIGNEERENHGPEAIVPEQEGPICRCGGANRLEGKTGEGLVQMRHRTEPEIGR